MTHTVIFHMRKVLISSYIWVSLLRYRRLLNTTDPSSIVEQTLGGLDVFLPYVHDYVSTFTGKSITTEQWKDHLHAYFQKQGGEKVKALKTVDFDVGVLQRLIATSNRCGIADVASW